jgi:hypothetical protein
MAKGLRTMPMRTMLLPFLMALSVIACTTGRDGTTGSSKPGKGAGDPQVRLGGKADGDSLFLVFERTVCFGTCPAYRIELFRNGHATWDGRAHVEKEGPHTARVGRDTLEAILKEAERIGFFGSKDVYDAPVTDLPSMTIRIVAQGRSKEVMARMGTPAELRAFGEYLDGLLRPLPWKPVPPQH